MPNVSVKDRVDIAFENLNRSGVVAKNSYEVSYVGMSDEELEELEIYNEDTFGDSPRGYWCCGSCAIAALHKEMPDYSGPWVYYHEQAAERLAKDGESYLMFGPNKNAASIILAALRSVGVNAEWSGDMNESIHVKGLVS